MSDSEAVSSRILNGNGFRMPTKAKWYPLYLENEDFMWWFDNLARGSPNTAVEMARVLYRYLKLRRITLDDLTAEIKTDQDTFEKRFMGFIGDLEKQGKAGGYIGNYDKTIKSWMRHQGKSFVRKVKISNRKHTPTLHREKTPTIEQVREIRSNASSRGRICIGAVVYGGQRLEVLGHQRYEDGLKLGDLPELNIDSLEFKKIPTLVVIRPELSKAGHIYRSFFPEPTCRDIEAYLQTRRAKGEELDSESPLVAVSTSHVTKGQRARNGRTSRHIVTAIVSRDIRNAMRPRYNYRPYVLRSFFQTALVLAESSGEIIKDYRIYWMGHTGDMSARYSTNKAMLPDDLIEDMRRAYERSLPFLVGATLNDEAIRRKNIMDSVQIIRALNPNITDSQVAGIMNVLKNSETVDDAIREITHSGIMITQSPQNQRKIRTEHGLDYGDYQIVDESHLTDYLKQGYEWVSELGAEEPKDSVKDETWAMSDGQVIEAGKEKVYGTVNNDGVLELRGDPTALNEIEKEMLTLGVETQKVEPGKRYLLRKK
ncbi:hypothetical protein E4G67_00945 [Candidatus Bathyarchaeota archaeon]|nr:MAG: hypothetical protein E4G67_00945 [Candidatus Bathyarchaeota archaeon]